MRLNFKNIKDSPLNLMRQAGYSYVGRDERIEEEAYERRLSSGDYPKFHVYIKREGDFVFVNLHLDQKEPSYSGSPAHSGEYEENEVLQKEAGIIKKVFSD
ncbi:MAG: hypothetical protein A2Y98_00770 [Candidatus Portnoybacteria bacterium RBG_19FT_COMBO_36_7]|uniref:Uncharacterized protein n=1 Tax=Candidatus Portnoybacteria bacterium RBG_19FT_COMBO_36_7 TaxID=1801992 RepID=A0A1G2F7E9_9BACT|nr:MAG: hypothetical protein A2Y98_00770 [Candidatus Portnoybacteria bacterium RBG_19FT_COMBO_36_7]